MADRVEREIEEILAKLDHELPPEAETTPISIQSRKKAKRSRPSKPARHDRRAPATISSTSMMFTGAGLVVGGLVLANAAPSLIWVSFAGVVLFLGAFLSSFFRQAPTRTAQPKGVFWRDRYIEYEPARSGFLSRIKRAFRR